MAVFDENGNYIATYWENGDLITKPRMNKIEDAIYENTANILDLLSNNPVSIDNEEPPSTDYLWIDTRSSYYDGDLTYEEDEETGEIINVPTFVDTPLVQHLIDLVKELRNDIGSLKTVIKTLQGQIDELYDRVGDGSAVGNNVYLISEDGATFVTEDGDLFISEDSTGGGTSPDTSITDGFITENGINIITEDGRYIIPE